MGTFSIWHWLIVLLVIAPIVVGAWTGWKRHIVQKTYVIIYCVLLAVGIIVEVGIEVIGEAAIVVLLVVLVVLPVGLFVGVHVVVRRLNTVGWSKWLGCIPVISTLVGIVLLFKRTPEPVPAQEGE